MSDYRQLARRLVEMTSEYVVDEDDESLELAHAVLERTFEEGGAVLGGLTAMGLAIQANEERKAYAQSKVDGRRAFVEVARLRRHEGGGTVAATRARDTNGGRSV